MKNKTQHHMHMTPGFIHGARHSIHYSSNAFAEYSVWWWVCILLYYSQYEYSALSLMNARMFLKTSSVCFIFGHMCTAANSYIQANWLGKVFMHVTFVLWVLLHCLQNCCCVSFLYSNVDLVSEHVSLIDNAFICF